MEWSRGYLGVSDSLLGWHSGVVPLPGSFLAHPKSIPGSVYFMPSEHPGISAWTGLGVKNPKPLPAWMRNNTTPAIPTVPENQEFLGMSKVSQEDLGCPTTSCLSPNPWRTSPAPICGSKNHCQQLHPSPRARGSQAGAGPVPGNLLALQGNKDSNPDWNNPDYHKTSPALHGLISVRKRGTEEFWLWSETFETEFSSQESTR